MSAFVVDHEHINVMIWAGLTTSRGHDGPLRWHFDNPSRINTLTTDTATEVGQLLLTTNIVSVDYLYRQTAAAEEYIYQRPQHTTWSIPSLLNAVHCYEYQACEFPHWVDTEAHAFCRALEQALIRNLPGYREGPWGITAHDTPRSTLLRLT